MDTLFAPPPDLKPHLRQYRFWIWLQMIVLRLYVRALKGPGTPFLAMCDSRGNVWIAVIGDAPGTAPAPDPFAFRPSRAYAAAIDGRAMQFRVFQDARGDTGRYGWPWPGPVVLVAVQCRCAEALAVLPLPDP